MDQTLIFKPFAVIELVGNQPRLKVHAKAVMYIYACVCM